MNNSEEIESLDIGSLLLELESEDGSVRERARHQLAARGTEIVPELSKLVEHKVSTTRWEAVKTLVEIDDPTVIPVLVEALRDEEFDVRWVAADGLIKFGELALPPIYNALEKDPHFRGFRDAAHHVLHDMRYGPASVSAELIDPILEALESPSAEEDVVPAVYRLNNKL